MNQAFISHSGLFNIHTMKPKHRRFLLITATLVCAFLIYQACTKKAVVSPKRSANVGNNTTTTTTIVYETPTGGTGSGSTGTGGTPSGQTAPNDLFIGLSKCYGLAYQADYFSLANEMQGGINNFWFYGKSNGSPFPTAEYATSQSGYATIDLPSHSVTLSSNLYPIVGKVRYKITDSGGNVVMYCHDTKGGYHSNIAANKRGNNHPNHSQRFLPYGTYTIELENLSDGGTMDFRFGRAGGNLTEFFQVLLSAGQTATRTLEIFDSPNAFKLNCNLI